MFQHGEGACVVPTVPVGNRAPEAPPRERPERRACILCVRERVGNDVPSLAEQEREERPIHVSRLAGVRSASAVPMGRTECRAASGPRKTVRAHTSDSNSPRPKPPPLRRNSHPTPTAIGTSGITAPSTASAASPRPEARPATARESNACEYVRISCILG